MADPELEVGGGEFFLRIPHALPSFLPFFFYLTKIGGAPSVGPSVRMKFYELKGISRFFFWLYGMYSQGKFVQFLQNRKGFPRRNYGLLTSNLYLDRKLYCAKVTMWCHELDGATDRKLNSGCVTWPLWCPFVISPASVRINNSKKRKTFFSYASETNRWLTFFHACYRCWHRQFLVFYFQKESPFKHVCTSMT